MISTLITTMIVFKWEIISSKSIDCIFEMPADYSEILINQCVNFLKVFRVLPDISHVSISFQQELNNRMFYQLFGISVETISCRNFTDLLYTIDKWSYYRNTTEVFEWRWVVSGLNYNHLEKCVIFWNVSCSSLAD